MWGRIAEAIRNSRRRNVDARVDVVVANSRHEEVERGVISDLWRWVITDGRCRGNGWSGRLARLPTALMTRMSTRSWIGGILEASLELIRNVVEGLSVF
jgi:hypothetical protein